MYAYKRVIDILMNGQVDTHALTIKLAQCYPEIFLELFCGAVTWHQTVINLIKTDQFVEAIKTLRKETGYGLKESKDVVDNLRWDLYRAGAGVQKPYSDAQILGPNLEELRQIILRDTNH
jgi:hypothetical protein